MTSRARPAGTPLDLGRSFPLTLRGMAPPPLRVARDRDRGPTPAGRSRGWRRARQPGPLAQAGRPADRDARTTRATAQRSDTARALSHHDARLSYRASTTPPFAVVVRSSAVQVVR